MNPKKPRIVICIPYYNRKDLLLNYTIDSINRLEIDKREVELEVFLFDDFSEEPPDGIEVRSATRFHSARHDRNLGLVGNYNHCAQQIAERGPCWSLILDADDVVYQKALDQIIELSRSGDEYSLAVGGCEVTDIINNTKQTRRLTDTSHVLSPQDAYSWFIVRNRCVSPAVWVNSQTYNDVRYDARASYCSDWDFYIRASAVAPVYVSSEIFANSIVHDSNYTWDSERQGLASTAEAYTIKKNIKLTKQLKMRMHEKLVLYLRAKKSYYKRKLSRKLHWSKAPS